MTLLVTGGRVLDGSNSGEIATGECGRNTTVVYMQHERVHVWDIHSMPIHNPFIIRIVHISA